MGTKTKLFELLQDSDRMEDVINKACASQNHMIALANRRDLLGKRMNQQKLECSECNTRQVQLIGYIDINPAKWKCRKCKHVFNWEGE